MEGRWGDSREGVWSGAWTWVEAFESDAAAAEHEQPRVQVKEGRDFPKLERRKPSEHEGALIQGSRLFDPQAKEAAQFGDAVHAVFEQIEWYTDEAEELLDGDAEASRWCGRAGGIGNPEAFYTDPEAVVWRERRFGVVLDGEFVRAYLTGWCCGRTAQRSWISKRTWCATRRMWRRQWRGINPNWIGTGACWCS